MPTQKGLEWNQHQLLVAFHLGKGKSVSQIMKLTGFKYRFIYKVKERIKQGEKPPSLDEEFIKNAPPPTVFGKTAKITASAGESGAAAEESGDQKPHPGDGGTPAPQVKPTKVGAGRVKFFGTLIESEYTPIMVLARQAAVEEWNWDPNMSFEDFMDTVLYIFFKDRGITLQGYIVNEEVAS